MAKYLQYISLYTNRNYKALFDTPMMKLHFRFIQRLNFHLGQLDCDGIGRINLIISKNPSEHLNTKRFGSILDIFIFINANITTDKDIYTYYYHTFKECWEVLNFNFERLKVVLENIKDFNSKWECTIKKAKWNKSKKYKIALVIKVDFEVSLFLKIDSSNNESKMILMSDLGTDYHIKDSLNDYCRKTYWKTDYLFVIEQSNQRDFWEYNVLTDELKFVYPRAECNDPHGQYDLGLMYFKGQYVIKDREKAKYWFEKAAQQNYKKAIKILNDWEEILLSE